jgi:KDO2-lipid IV(A) lauroyltransferase
VVVVYKKLESQFFDKFMGDSRTVLFNAFEGYVESSDSIFYAYDHRHEPKIYIFYTDQYPYRIATKHLLPTPFMHQKTLVMTGGAALAHKFRMSVWYMNVDRTRKGHYDVVFKPIADDASTMSPEAIMEKFYAYLENDIEANPSNYLWSHQRWKRKKSDRKFFETDENNKDESHE